MWVQGPDEPRGALKISALGDASGGHGVMLVHGYMQQSSLLTYYLTFTYVMSKN